MSKSSYDGLYVKIKLKTNKKELWIIIIPIKQLSVRSSDKNWLIIFDTIIYFGVF